MDGSKTRPYAFFIRFLHQLQSLHYAESVLLIHDYETKLFELNAFLDQGMRPNHELSISLRNMPPDGALAILLERAGQDNNAVAGFSRIWRAEK